MSKSDLPVRPIYHRKRDSIEVHSTVVFAALAVTRFIEDRTGCSIRKFARTARRYQIIQIRAGTTPSPPKTRSQQTSATPWSSSSNPNEVRTKSAGRNAGKSGQQMPRGAS
jgi:hypothetical protein